MGFTEYFNCNNGRYIIGIMLGAVVGFIGIGAIVRIVLKFLGKSKQKINKR